MLQQKRVRLAELKVGILVLVGLLLFLVLILQQSWGIRWFSSSAKVLAYLTDVGGLKPGAPVWFAGMEIGRVRAVAIVPPESYDGNAKVFSRIAEIKKELEALEADASVQERDREELRDQIRDLKTGIRFVEVRLDIDPEYLDRISRDSEISIESRGLIGDSFIDISPGTMGVPPVRQGEYYVIESVQSAGFRKIMTGVNDVVANFGVLSEHFKEIVTRINPAKVGSDMGDIVNDMQRTIREANRTFSSATSLLDEMQRGKGTVGRLVADPELHNRLTEALEKFNTLAENIQNGQGTIGRLMSDPSLFENANRMLARADTVMERMENGEGTLGKLSKDDAFYRSSTEALAKFALLMEEIEGGKGTMGKLLKDPSLYNNLDQSSAEITKLLYDIRKDPKKFLTIRFRIF